MNDKISIIVPIYNTELYLEECIKSIINQSYKNLEILLINDGSCDNSLSICNQFEINDSRIKVFNRKNSGVSNTRNFGINESSGKYIVFIDSDDYIDSTMIEKMYNCLIKKDVDVVRCLSYIFDKNGEKHEETINNLEDKLYSGDNLTKLIYDYCTPTKVNCYSPLLMIKKSKIVKYNSSLSMMEDTEFYVRLTMNIDSMFIMKDYLYYYRYNQQSASKSINNCIKNINGIMYSGKVIKDDLVKANLFDEEMEKLINNKLFGIITPKLSIYSKTKINIFYKTVKSIFTQEEYIELINNLDYKKLPMTKKIYSRLLRKKKFKLFTIIYKIKTLI